MHGEYNVKMFRELPPQRLSFKYVPYNTLYKASICREITLTFAERHGCHI
jgi:hypothetical protein